MLDHHSIVGLRMRRQHLVQRADTVEYDALYRDTSPGQNVYWNGFGDPPSLTFRADFDDIAYNRSRQKSRTLLKGRFQGGNLGWIERADLELFAGAYRKPLPSLTPAQQTLWELLLREGPMNIQGMKEATGLLVKEITPVLHRLQEAFLIYEAQYDGEWDRGWYPFAEMFPDAALSRYTRQESLEILLQRFARRMVLFDLKMVGIGLFRSEFLYLGRNDFPTEEEQFQAYKQAVQTMAGKKVIIRTLDIGADKQVEYFNLGKEENPALGYRAIRICLKQPEIFKAQLRALFRAAVYGNLSVMYPMITSTEEVEKIYAIVAEVEEELKKQEVQYKIPEQGIMIETPAAVMISDRLAEMVDFFSIGTNDLTQYTLAIDRQNEQLDDFYNPHHEAVLRMIRMVVENAHKCGKWAGICGELGADLTLTEQFVRMGVDELSVAPSMILKLRKVVREMKAEE